MLQARSIGLALFLALPGAAMAGNFAETFPGHAPHEYPEVQEYLDSFNYRTGEVKLPGGQATLMVPEGYYYLDAEDSSQVLSDLWGNPGGSELGMIFPAGMTPMDDASWGADIYWDPMGYVSDEEAAKIDYDALLKDMQSDTARSSKERVKQGYDSVELIGWAEPPHYDQEARKLHWAQELQFGDAMDPTLNYELRALGREGVLSVTFIGAMDQLGEIKAALPDVAQMVSFNEGKRYADFDPSVDTVAAVGIAGLIAGKVLTSKVGLAAMAALLLKKFWFVLFLPFVFLKRFFSRG